MNRIKRWIRGYFGFSRTETNGLLLLLPLTFLVIVVPPIYRSLTNGSDNPDFSQESRALDSLLAGWQPGRNSTVHPSATHYFAFDPNSVTPDDLQRLGLPPHVAETLIHYREKGGRFRVKKDLKKIYGLDGSTYDTLAPWIALPDSIAGRRQAKESLNHHSYQANNVEIKPFDLNTADTTRLKQIRGIGTVLSSRIIRYRRLLGGFVNKDQLKEVYGLDTTVIARLASKAYIASGFMPRRIDVNKATDSALAHHPYISYRVARALVTFRFQHGPYKSVSGIRKVELIDDQLANRIEPYLTTGNR